MVPCAEFPMLEFEPNDGSIKFTNIEEDFDGADLVTFVCPVCGETHKSRVYG
jgi:predicted RNA-binding Zn-ribbon protein involved in translation (DUF1610 family)